MVWKRILCIILVAFWALPALAATGSATWDGSAGGAGEGVWENEANWTPAQYPVDGDTATFDGTEGQGLPDTDLPNAGTIHFSVTGAHTMTLETLLSGAAIGAVTVNHADAVITAGANITGAVTITDGTLAIAAARTFSSTVAIATAGTLDLDASGTVTASDTITMAGSSTLSLASGTTLDIAVTKSLTGSAGSLSNAGAITGVVNMTAVTTWAGTGTITVDEDGTVNLGTDTANSQSVDIAADVTIGDSFTCLGFDGSSGEITMAGTPRTITVGAGGLKRGTATVDTVRLLSITFTEDTSVCNWASSAEMLGTFTLDSAITVALDGDLYGKAVAGTGVFAIGGDNLWLRMVANDWWPSTVTATATYPARVRFATDTDCSNAGDIDVGNALLELTGPDPTITLEGDVACYLLRVASVDGDTYTDVVIEGALTTKWAQIGSSDSVNMYGYLTLGTGQNHTITSGLNPGAGVNPLNALTLGGNLSLGGTMNLAKMAVDFRSVIIEASGDITIDGTNAASIANTAATIFANGNTLTIDDLGYATTSSPILCVSCTVGGTASGAGVEFVEPARMLLGVGF